MQPWSGGGRRGSGNGAREDRGKGDLVAQQGGWRGGQGCQGVLTGARGRGARHLRPVTPSLTSMGGRHRSGLERTRPRGG